MKLSLEFTVSRCAYFFTGFITFYESACDIEDLAVHGVLNYFLIQERYDYSQYIDGICPR